MAPVSTWSHSAPAQAVFDDIEKQLTLSDETLVTIASAFLDEFKAGLGSYGHPMAMMCVP